MLVSVTGAPPLQAEQSVNATPRKVPPGQAEQSTVLVPPSRAETCMVTPRTYSVVTPWLVKAGEGLEHGQSFVYACCAVVVSSWRPGVTSLSACLSIVCTPPSKAKTAAAVHVQHSLRTRLPCLLRCCDVRQWWPGTRCDKVGGLALCLLRRDSR